MDLDYLDIYEDLDAFQKNEEKKSTELRELEAKYNDSIKSVEALQVENTDLKKQIKRIGINFQNLLDTAKAEIKRKDKQIAQLQKEKDDICFRRNRPCKENSDFGGANHNTNNWYKNNSEFPEHDSMPTANERQQRNAFQEYSVPDYEQPSGSKAQQNHERHISRSSNDTHKYVHRDERSESKYESESKREKYPRNNSQTDQHSSRHRERSREQDRCERGSAREYSRSRNRLTDHSRREVRERRNQRSSNEKECGSGGKFDDYTRKHHSRERYGERSRYNGQDQKIRCDNQEHRESRSDFKKLQHGDNKNEYKTCDNMNNSKKSKIEKQCANLHDPKPNNLFRDEIVKPGESDIAKYDRDLKSKKNSTEAKTTKTTMTKILSENKLTKKTLLAFESDSGSETNKNVDRTRTSNGMTTPKKAALFDKFFGGTPTNVGTMNITNELGLAKSNFSSATTSPSKYTDASEQSTKSPPNNEINSKINDCSSDSYKEFDFRNMNTNNAVDNKLKPKESADGSAGGIQSVAECSTKDTSSNVNTNIGSERDSMDILLSDDEDYYEINKTNENKNVLDVEDILSDKVTLSSFGNMGAVKILQNTRLPNIYEIRAYQRRLKEEAVAAKKAKRESITKMKDAELIVTKTNRGAPETTAKRIPLKQETVSKEQKSSTIMESNEVVITKEALAGADINIEKNTGIEKLEIHTIKDGSKNSNKALNANELEKADLIADTKSSAEPNNTMLPVNVTLEGEKNCELKNDEIVIAMSIPETTNTEIVDMESEVPSSSITAEKSVALNNNLDKISTGNYNFDKTETVLQNVNTMAEKASITNKIQADTIVSPDIECDGQSATEDTIHEAKSKCNTLHINSPTENVEAPVCNNNDSKLFEDIMVRENNVGSRVTSKKPQQPLEDGNANNTKPNDPEATGKNPTKPSNIIDDKTKGLIEENSTNIHNNDPVKDNKLSCGINNCLDTTVINVLEACGVNTRQHSDICVDKEKTSDLLVEGNNEKEVNVREQQREIVSSEPIPEEAKNIMNELQPITERNEMKSKDILNEAAGNKGISGDQLLKDNDRIHSVKSVINQEDLTTDESSVRNVFLEHKPIVEQKIIDQRNITDASRLAKAENISNCTNTVKEHSNVTETEASDTENSQIIMTKASTDFANNTKAISIYSASLKLQSKPVIPKPAQIKFPAEMTKKNMAAAALEKSVSGTGEHSALIEKMKRSEIMWKFKIPKISSKRKRDEESEAKNIKRIDVNGDIAEKDATKVDKAINIVEELTKPLSKKSRKDDKIVKLQAREKIQVPDLSAKIERERLLKDETIAERQRLLDQEKSRCIIKEIDNWARRKVGETTESLEKEKQSYAQQSHQISERLCVDASSVKSEKMMPEIKQNPNNLDTGSKVVEKTSGTEGTERYDKYNKEEMKCNVDTAKPTDLNSDNRRKYKPQNHKHEQVDAQRVLSKEKLEDSRNDKNCLPNRKNELEKVVSVTENTKEKTDITRLSNDNISDGESCNISPHKPPLSTMAEKKHATKILQQHKNQLIEEPRAFIESTRKPEDHKANVHERRRSQNSEEKTLSKTISHAHEIPSSANHKARAEIQQKKTHTKKDELNEEANEKETQPHVVRGQKEAQNDERSTKLTYKESENNADSTSIQSEPAKLESCLSKETHSTPQTIQVEKSTEVQKSRREHEKLDSKKRTTEKSVSVKEAEENDIYEKRAKIDVAAEKIEKVQNVCDREVHFTETIKVLTPAHDSLSSQIAPTCNDRIPPTAEVEVTACTPPKEAKRSRSVTDADATSDSDVCREQPQQRNTKRCRTHIKDSDDNETSVNTITSTLAGGYVDLDVDSQQKKDDILDILQNYRAIDMMSEISCAPQTPTSLPAYISQDSQYEELDSHMQLIFASPKVSGKTSTSTLSAIDKQNSTVSDLIKVLQPVASQQAEVSVNGSSALMPTSALAPSSVESALPPFTATVANNDFSVSDTILSDITINSCHASSADLTINETNQCTLNTNSSLSDSNASTKHISLGSSDYRFEKVSENVVNLFITRKRRGKRKPNANTATTNTIPTI